jgi:hypothetical protein
MRGDFDYDGNQDRNPRCKQGRENRYDNRSLGGAVATSDAKLIVSL